MGFPWMGPLRHYLMGVIVEENETDLKISAPLPGVTKDDVDVMVGPDAVVISLKTKETTSKGEEDDREDSMNYAWPMNFARGLFRTRRCPLPTEVDPETAKAKLENGVLTITVDKKNPSKKISIE
jgi:HSP20 family protein